MNSNKSVEFVLSLMEHKDHSKLKWISVPNGVGGQKMAMMPLGVVAKVLGFTDTHEAFELLHRNWKLYAQAAKRGLFPLFNETLEYVKTERLLSHIQFLRSKCLSNGKSIRQAVWETLVPVVWIAKLVKFYQPALKQYKQTLVERGHAVISFDESSKDATRAISMIVCSQQTGFRALWLAKGEETLREGTIADDGIVVIAAKGTPWMVSSASLVKVDNFSYEEVWNFGDGSPTVLLGREVPAAEAEAAA